MHLTAILRAKPKTRTVMVLMESLSSGHNRISFRDKNSDQREILAYDPLVQMLSVYKEKKKIRTMRGSFKLKEDWNMPQLDNEGNIISQPNGIRKLFDENIRKRRIPTLDS